MALMLLRRVSNAGVPAPRAVCAVEGPLRMRRIPVRVIGINYAVHVGVVRNWSVNRLDFMNICTVD